MYTIDSYNVSGFFFIQAYKLDLFGKNLWKLEYKLIYIFDEEIIALYLQNCKTSSNCSIRERNINYMYGTM